MLDQTHPHPPAAPADTARDVILDILIIGAGFSGICTAIQLLKQGRTRFLIFEKSGGIGGTWYDNTYPGAACDVPSHFYCFSFEPNPDWSRVYSPQAEIRAYLEHCADKYGVRPYIRNHSKVEALEFNNAAALWEARFTDGRIVQARHVVNGSGGLHQPSLPDIPGRDTFAGSAMHSARWNHDCDMTGKKVAIIGSAASAIQIIPQLAPMATRLMVFQRTPNYIVPRGDRDYTEKEKERFRRWPWLLRLYRWTIFTRMDFLLFPITRKDSSFGKRAMAMALKFMRREVKSPSMHGALIPDYPMGCKRILVSDDYYETLNLDNVSVISTGIDRIAENGIVTKDGHLHEADVIIYATGYDIEAHMKSIAVKGPDGRMLVDQWKDGPEAYYGACVAGFPNFYFVTGPNTGVGTTSVVFMIENQVNYILKCIERAGTDGLISVKPDAMQAYNVKLHGDLQETVWAGSCKSWYKRPDGKITTLYPQNARAFRRELKNVRFSDFEVRKVAVAPQPAE